MKKVLIFVITWCFVLSPMMISAEEIDVYIPPDNNIQYINISSINCSISSKSGKVNPSVLVRGKKSYDMNVTLILQEKNGTSWTNVTKWTAHSYGTRMEINKSMNCTKGITYRAVCNVKVNNEVVQKSSGSVIGK